MPEKSQINLTCQYKVQNESFTIVLLTPCKMTTSRDQSERRENVFISGAKYRDV